MMSKFLFCSDIINDNPVDKEEFIKERCRDRVVLDLGCVRYNAKFSDSDPGWLHKKIKSTAKEVVGVDIVLSEIEILNKKGYNIVFGDVTQPLDIKNNFDVIVAGDLIEHLTNFEGFFDNCRRLLKLDGELIISTPNPFYVDEFNYVSFKKGFLVNPEHTCWIDPMCLSQLSKRCGFMIESVNYVKSSWKLSMLIFETKNHVYDILKAEWSNNSTFYKIFRRVGGMLFDLVYMPYKYIFMRRSAFVKYSDYIAILRRADD